MCMKETAVAATTPLDTPSTRAVAESGTLSQNGLDLGSYQHIALLVNRMQRKIPMKVPHFPVFAITISLFY